MLLRCCRVSGKLVLSVEYGVSVDISAVSVQL